MSPNIHASGHITTCRTLTQDQVTEWLGLHRLHLARVVGVAVTVQVSGAAEGAILATGPGLSIRGQWCEQ